ncbi:hypothetical protein [Gilvimarinus algae]|uniref:Uncharacterized protein n=1 Tax=Gilvimarinus algae TaxID=3058037 RepID=A0ABT8TCD5_9GAMM|nr:hypothetical protein [Gilvimarinus sp. SDUM040014]MDO3381570.1 hypothetical protein [Gilvimarinus sp. SDUM040014]
MSRNNLDDWLERTLAEEDYLEDAGFTESVMAALPDAGIDARRVKTLNWAVGLAASALAGAVFPWSKVGVALFGLSLDTWLIAATALAGAFTLAAIGGGLWSFKRAP